MDPDNFDPHLAGQLLPGRSEKAVLHSAAGVYFQTIPVTLSGLPKADQFSGLFIYQGKANALQTLTKTEGWRLT